jgi:flagella synthesis protein FlgN
MSSTHQQLISALIQQDIDTINRLKSTLQDECDALKSRQHSKLTDLLSEKTRLLKALELSSSKRAQILTASSLPPSKTAWEQLLQDYTDSETRAQWVWIQQEFQVCHDMNAVNGKLIARSRSTLGHLVNVLRGQDSAPDLYNQSGSKQPNGGAYTMVKA